MFYVQVINVKFCTWYLTLARKLGHYLCHVFRKNELIFS